MERKLLRCILLVIPIFLASCVEIEEAILGRYANWDFIMQIHSSDIHQVDQNQQRIRNGDFYDLPFGQILLRRNPHQEEVRNFLLHDMHIGILEQIQFLTISPTVVHVRVFDNQGEFWILLRRNAWGD